MIFGGDGICGSDWSPRPLEEVSFCLSTFGGAAKAIEDGFGLEVTGLGFGLLATVGFGRGLVSTGAGLGFHDTGFALNLDATGFGFGLGFTTGFALGLDTAPLGAGFVRGLVAGLGFVLEGG